MNRLTDTQHACLANASYIMIPAGLGYLACHSVAILNPLTAAIFIGGSSIAVQLSKYTWQAKSSQPLTLKQELIISLTVTGAAALVTQWPLAILTAAVGLRSLATTTYKICAPTSYNTYIMQGKWSLTPVERSVSQPQKKEDQTSLSKIKPIALISGCIGIGLALSGSITISVSTAAILFSTSMLIHVIATEVLHKFISESKCVNDKQNAYLKDKLKSMDFSHQCVSLAYFAGLSLLTQQPLIQTISLLGTLALGSSAAILASDMMRA